MSVRLLKIVLRVTPYRRSRSYDLPHLRYTFIPYLIDNSAMPLRQLCDTTGFGSPHGRNPAPQRTHGIYIPGAVIAVNDCRGKQRPSSG
jgi:hypothetical protein